MTRLFATPTDLVGRIATGDILRTATGEFLRAHQLADPKEFSEDQRAGVCDQFVYEMFGTEYSLVPNTEDWNQHWWPLRKVEISDGQS